MKKRIITLLAVLALLVTCAVFAVQADGETTPTYIDLATFKCPCSACTAARATNPDYVLPTENWVTTYTHTPAAGGHYYYRNSSKPGSQSSITSGEVVIVLDNASLSFGGANRSLRVGAAATTKLHVIGNNGGLYYRGTGTGEGIIVQVDTGAQMHIYGDLSIGKTTEATGVTTSGGLVKVNAGCTFHIHDCDGMGLPTNDDPVLNAPALANTTSSLGGISNVSGNFIMDAGTLNGTSTCYRGAVLSNNGGTITINGGTINGGIAGNRGGVIMNNSGTLNINGGTIKGNANQTASYRGVVLGGGTCNFTGGTIVSPNKGLGDGIAITAGVLNISGTATVENVNGTWDNNIWRWEDAAASSVIQIDSAWTGTASVHIPNHSLTNHGGEFESAKLKYGTITDGIFTDGTSTTAKLTGMHLENNGHDDPRLAGYQGLVVTCRAALFENGKLTDWYITPADAIYGYLDAKGTDKYIKLWADYAVNINTTIYLDLNGRTYEKMVQKENGKIYAFDSTAAAGEASAASITGATLEPVVQIDGKTYFVKEGVIYPVEYKLTSISLRAAQEAVYYTASIKVHEDLNATAGVAVTVADEAPDNSLANYLFTDDTNTESAYTGVLVKDILSEATTDRAEKPIKARAYVQIGNDLYMSELVDYSLLEVVNAVLEQELYTNQAGFENLYNKLSGLGYELPVLSKVEE